MQVTNLHEACEAVRSGDRWIHTDSAGNCWTYKRKRDVVDYNDDPRAGENVWELYMEVAMRVVGAIPFDEWTQVAEGQTLTLEGLTMADCLVCAKCIRRVLSKARQQA